MKNRIIEDIYNISIIKKQLLSEGYACRKWILTTENGKYVLKQMNIKELNRLKFVNSIQKLLSDNNLTANIINTKDNCTHFIYDSNFYVLYQYIDGYHLDKHKLSIENQYELGCLLGNIHRVLNSSMIAAGENYNSRCLNMREPNIDKITDLIILHKKNDNKEAVKLLKSKLRLLKKYNYEDIRYLFFKYNDKIVHGDFYLDNIIKSDSLICLDLDQTCVFPLQYEIYRAMSMICYDGDFDDLKVLKNIKSFLKGYQSIYSISVEDLIDGLEIFNYISLNSLYCLGVNDDISYAKYKLKMIKWVLKNRDSIIRIIQEVKDEKANSNFSFSL